MTRRRFVGRGAGVAAATVVAGGLPRICTAAAKPAVLGGDPLHNGQWPVWPITDETEETAIRDVLQSGAWYRYAGGKSVSQFEKLWAEATGARHCQATSSGTAALITALGALDIGPGDEVLLSPYTFIATVNSVLLHHALPVFVDTDPQTAQINPDKVDDRINGSTRCILPVHLAGTSCDMDRIMEISDRHGLRVVEDACQSHTGEWKGSRLGTLGDAGCFSFQNSKNLASGEGGAVITNDDGVYERAHTFHNNGYGEAAAEGGFTANGGNFRLTEFQGALLIQQHQRLEQQSRRREEGGAYLDSLLGDIDGVSPKRKPAGATRHGYHLYLFDYDSNAFAGMTKDQFRAALAAEGISASGGYGAMNRMPWVERFLSAPGFKRIYGKKRLDRWREENQLPGNDATIETTCWLSQNILLADKQALELIPAAILRIQDHASEIAKV